MKRLLSLFVVFLVLPVLAVAQQVTFHSEVPSAGTTRAILDTTELIYLITVNAEGADQSFDVTQAERKIYTETILEVDGDVVTKRRVAFTEATERGNKPMQGMKVTTGAISGKTYIIDNTGDSLVVSNEDGSKVSKEEFDKLAASFRNKTDGQFDKVLDGRTMTVGEEITLTDDMLKQFVSELAPGAMTPESARIKLLSVGESQGMSVAKFEVVAAISGSKGFMEMSLTMKGTAEVCVDKLWPLSLVMKGTVSGVGNHSGMPLSADGEVLMARIATYE